MSLEKEKSQQFILRFPSKFDFVKSFLKARFIHKGIITPIVHVKDEVRFSFSKSNQSRKSKPHLGNRTTQFKTKHFRWLIICDVPSFQVSNYRSRGRVCAQKIGTSAVTPTRRCQLVKQRDIGCGNFMMQENNCDVVSDTQ